jgi:hypothetical protein
MSGNSNLNMFLFLFIGLTSFVSAHTWIEQISAIAPNGTFVGAPGFARGNVLRTNPAFSDTAMTNLIPPDGRSTGNEILSTDPICMPSQQSQNQTAGSPRLQAAAGSGIALRYQENGHVTLPNNQPGKPANRGTVFVYGTTEPSSSDTLLGIHKVWNADQTGGDKRGVLLSSQNFDDGQCYQVNTSPISAQRQQEFPHTADALMGINMWCQQDTALPANAPSGQPYTLYWVWDWPTAPGSPGLPDGKQELYTTCMDVDIIASSGDSSQTTSGFIVGQDLNYAAIPSEFAELNNPTAVAAPSEPPISNGGAGTGVAASATAANSAPAAASTGVAVTSQAAGTALGGANPEQYSLTHTQTTFAVVTSKQPLTDMPPSTLTVSSAPGPQAGPSQAIVPGALTNTVTEYASVTQTVFHTIYPSGFKKRTRKSPRDISPIIAPKANSFIITVTKTVIASADSPSSASASPSTSAEFELRGRGPRMLRW